MLNNISSIISMFLSPNFLYLILLGLKFFYVIYITFLKKLSITFSLFNFIFVCIEATFKEKNQQNTTKE